MINLEPSTKPLNVIVSKSSLSSLMDTLNEIDCIMSTTFDKLEYVIDESKPRDAQSEDAPKQNITLGLMAERVNCIRRLASEIAEMTGKLLGN